MAKYRRIGTVSLCYGDMRKINRASDERNLILEYIRKAGELAIDILLFQEEYGFFAMAQSACEQRKKYAPGELELDLPCDTQTVAEMAVTLEDEYIKKVQAQAYQSKVNVVLPIIERAGEKVYNSLLPITSDGKILAPYRKMHPVQGELDSGITPGEKEMVHLLADIKVGFSICFDINFNDVYDEAKQAGAELMLWSSMWMGGNWLKARATQYGFCLASATPDGCTYVDIDGSIITEAYTLYPQIYGENNLIFEDINFDKDVFHCLTDGKLNDIVRKYKSSVHIRNKPQDCFCVIESLDENSSIQTIKNEFGIENYYNFVQRYC